MIRVLFYILLFSTYSFSQDEYNFKIADLTTDHGLATRFTNFIHKDSRGIIWIGTQQGLHRFDGANFKVYNETFGLPFNEVMEIYEDSQGWFWLYRNCSSKDKDYCFKNLVFFHPITEEIKTLEERFGSNLPFQAADIERIRTSPSKNRLVIITAQQSFLINPEGNILKLPLNVDEKRHNIFAILDDGRMGAIPDSTNFSNYFLLSPKGHLLATKKLPNTLSKINLFSLKLNKDNLSTKNTQFFLNQSGELEPLEVRKYFPSLQPFISLHRQFLFDKDNQTCWFAGRDGVRKITIEKKRFLGFKDSGERWMLQGLKPFSEHEIIFPIGFYNFVNDSNNYIDGHRAFSANYPKFSADELSIKSHLFPLKFYLVIQNQNAPLKYNKIDDFFKHHFKQINSYQKINDLFWFGTDKGFWNYHPESNTITPFQNFNNFPEFDGCFIHEIQHKEGENYWIATNRGLFLWSVNEGIKAQYNHSAKGQYYIPTNSIYHFYQKSDNTLWLASRDGLIHLNLVDNHLSSNDQHYEFFTEKDGLLSNACVAVYEDDFGFLWIATSKGLVQFELASSNFKVYTKRNGLTINYFRDYNHYQAPTGTLILGGVDGLVSFHPKDFKNENVAAPNVPLIVVEVERYNPENEKFELFTPQLFQTDEITLNPQHPIFNLRVALSDYRNAQEHLFAYRIKGYQEDWQEEKSNNIRINGLPFGEYELEIKGRLADGRYSNNILKIPVRVLTPFYFQAWFILLSLLLIAGIILLFFHIKTRNLQNSQKLLRTEIAKATTQIETDKKTIENQAEELKQIDKLKSRFFANVSHELRTPLTLMLGPIDAALKENQLTNRAYTNLLLAQKNGHQLHRLINEILDLSKLEAGKLEIVAKPTAWYNFLKNIVANFESMANRKEIDFTFEYPGNKYLQILTDKRKVEIIILNLLSNAFKFTSDGGRIHCLAKDEGNFLFIEIKDTGRGIHPEDLPNIFDRFYQTKYKNAAAEGGTGIGLALSNEFVKLLNGKISVKSELGKGTTFTLHLPKKEIISQINSAAAQQIHEENLQNLNDSIDFLSAPIASVKVSTDNAVKDLILLVEDNYQLRGFIESLLLPNFAISKAENGLVALEKITQNQQNGILPDLIITDIMMPLMDGYQLIEKLKADSILAQIPILVLTARAGLDDKIKALRIGIDDYLTKPFAQEELFARIDNLLRNAKNRKQLQNSQSEFADGSSQNAENVTKTPPLNATTQKWLADLENTILKNIGNPSYNIDQLANDLTISKRQLSRRIKETIGTTPAEYLKTIRFAHALTLLEQQDFDTVKAVARSVGFKDVVNFSRQFKKRFGKNPSEYLD